MKFIFEPGWCEEQEEPGVVGEDGQRLNNGSQNDWILNVLSDPVFHIQVKAGVK